MNLAQFQAAVLDGFAVTVQQVEGLISGEAESRRKGWTLDGSATETPEQQRLVWARSAGETVAAGVAASHRYDYHVEEQRAGQPVALAAARSTGRVGRVCIRGAAAACYSVVMQTVQRCEWA